MSASGSKPRTRDEGPAARSEAQAALLLTQSLAAQVAFGAEGSPLAIAQNSVTRPGRVQNRDSGSSGTASDLRNPFAKWLVNEGWNPEADLRKTA
jgi:hypothetical protein